ncbi:MAG: cytochrome d ubiquinol oxidase subunit II [Thermoleophilaceae bacterium]
MAEACLGLVLVALTAYVVLGGADFGGGFWDLTAGGPRRGAPLRGLIERSMTPVWEANHVWLPFLLVLLWTAFPRFFGSVMSTLYVPLFLAAGGIILRGTAFVLRPHTENLRVARGLGAAFAASSVTVPFCFGAAAGAIASGRVPVGNARGDPWSTWLNPTSVSLGILSVITGAYLAAVFLAGDAERVDDTALAQAVRMRALGAGVAAGAAALGTLIVVRSDAPALYEGITSTAGVILIIGSALLGLATLALVWKRRFSLSRATAAGAVACVTGGWVVAQSPYLLPGAMTLDGGAAGEATLTALMIAAGTGMALLVPALVLLYRLVLQGRLDKPYEPIDARWRT